MEGGSSYGCDLDNLNATELRLGLPGSDEPTKPSPRGCKRAFSDTDEESRSRTKPSSESDSIESGQDFTPVAKAQVVGWPPVRSHRRNNFLARKAESQTARIYVKVSMDGAPYLRKLDLKVYKGYKDLREALEGMFKCFSLGEGCNGSEHAVTYEDKDGDWMLVGDVPWGMFTNSCKRLRIMRGNEARGRLGFKCMK